MDELDLLKKDWKKRESSFQQIGENEIYGMLHKRSSSIVKWIVIISVLELVLWASISFFTADEEYFKTLKLYHLETAMPVISAVNYGVILYFIYHQNKYIHVFSHYIKTDHNDNPEME